MALSTFTVNLSPTLISCEVFVRTYLAEGDPNIKLLFLSFIPHTNLYATLDCAGSHPATLGLSFASRSIALIPPAFVI